VDELFTRKSIFAQRLGDCRFGEGRHHGIAGVVRPLTPMILLKGRASKIGKIIVTTAFFI